MGQTEQTPTNDTFDHPRFGNLTVRKSPTDFIVMELNLYTSSKKDYQTWAKEVPRHSFEDDPNLLPLQHKFSQMGICNSHGRVSLTYEYYPYLLDFQVKSRMSRDFKFNNSQLWYVLYTLLESTREHEHINEKFNDIRPKNILINAEGQIKTINKLSLPTFQNAYMLAFQKKQHTYLSPQQLAALERNQLHPQLTHSVCESFSIGLTMLQMCVLRECQLIYNYQNYKIDFLLLQKMLKEASLLGLYAEPLMKLIRLMLQPDHSRRHSPGQILHLLRPYQENIINLKPFNVSRAPSEQQIKRYHDSVSKYPHFKNYINNIPKRLNLVDQVTIPVFNLPPPPPARMVSYPAPDRKDGMWQSQSGGYSSGIPSLNMNFVQRGDQRLGGGGFQQQRGTSYWK